MGGQSATVRRLPGGRARRCRFAQPKRTSRTKLTSLYSRTWGYGHHRRGSRSGRISVFLAVAGDGVEFGLDGDVGTLRDDGQQLHVEAVGEQRDERLGHVGQELVLAKNRLDAGLAAHHLELEVVGDEIC